VHVPDGFLDAPTTVATGVVAAAALGLALRGARRELDERTAPLAGLAATFVFAAQMLNFPVGAGTSGHLLGGALVAVLVGPSTAILCMSVVFVVQALLFADGGITALGTNIDLMGVVTVLVGWGVFRTLQTVLPKRPGSVAPAAGIAAFVSVPAAALCFVGLYAIGGVVDIPLPSLTAAMVGVHVLIGIGEGLITALAVGSIVAVRPDLVYGARRVLAARPLEVRTGAGASR
jgi:cobalt/nickel transport system permease protein